MDACEKVTGGGGRCGGGGRVRVRGGRVRLRVRGGGWVTWRADVREERR